MTATLPDFSRRRELALHARVIADVQAVAQALDIPMMLTGAFARDLHVFYAHGIDTIRQTEDVDFALAIADWPAFARLKQRLVGSEQFREVPGAQQRLRHASGLPVDLIPFAGVENADRQIDWPPGGEFRMNVLGFREALASSLSIHLPEGVVASVVSLPALVLLKIIAWQDRHYRAPRKDAQDLALIAANYLDLGNMNRLGDEFRVWMEEDNFDLTHMGARMLGVDMAKLLDEAGRERLAAIVAEQADAEAPGLLPQEMFPQNADRARMLLDGILEGLYEK